ncbi:hypothetical protein V499_03575 [Pseudogymnoascus sp. VKM F-103]|uniref:Thiamine pyrophosphokinase n=1 Tax=Pseudogymnoascus verrucosus TaxID=342668 RepID=A0A1B8GWS4_9PEZI|nr:uncharacterized protein VE01_01520 [Pseudogymnoascus verrucosus]KFY76884.1 hypothetical protein V499_03575 [Pseudogymnoascus sp. VKM F-103]OBU00303.1 hypothetical protein VE01_01520 [Pseudogymnoascus verrucosus]
MENSTGGASPVMKWDPARLISHDHGCEGYALLTLNQPLDNLDLLRSLWERAGYRIAADGGANRLHKVFHGDSTFENLMKRIPLEVIHGDLDSLHQTTRSWALAHSTEVVLDPSQDSTDFTKCVSYISKHYLPKCDPPPDIIVLGGLGGRVDQGLSILHHLYKGPQIYPQGRIYLVSTSAITFLLTAGTHQIIVKNPEARVLGKNIGILPVGVSAKITTKGLKWDVEDWETSFGGQVSTSNMVLEAEVTVTTNADVLFTIDLDMGEEE